MPNYSIDLKIPNGDLEEFIEHLRTIGAADSIQFTIEAPTRRQAVRETTELLGEFASFRGDYLSTAAAEGVSEGLKINSARTTAVGL